MDESKWKVFDYEIEMFENLQKIKFPTVDDNSLRTLKNAITESLVLHTRILIDIIISKGTGKDDIFLKDLLPLFKSDEIEKLKKVYGGRDKKGSPCWEFNKLLVHATSHRTIEHNYSQSLNKVIPLIKKIVIDLNNYKNKKPFK